ncbi:MAG: PAS domain S-box protein [Oligoflexia bacterium]|nr:PAS domain S-box protein [Oligoflexia bacterium]
MADQDKTDIERQLKAIVDTVVDGIITIDGAGRVHTFNPAAERIFGYRAAEVIGQNISMLMPEPDRSQHDGYLETYLRTGQHKIIGSSRELVALRKDGTSVPIDLSVTEMQVGGQPMFTGVTRDITDRLRDRSTLENQVRAINAAQAVIEFELDGTIIDANDRFLALVGCGRDELIGRHQRIFLPPGIAESQEYTRLWQALARGEFQTGEYERRAMDGRTLWMQATYTPILGLDGQPERVMKFVTDITARKLAQTALAQQHQELEASARIDRISARVMAAINHADNTARPGADMLRVLAEEAGYRPLALYEHDDWQAALGLSASIGLRPGPQQNSFKTGQGLVGEAAAARKPTFIDAPLDSPFSLDTGVGILGAATLFALPLVHREKLVGVIAGAAQSRLSARERSWLSQVADQVAVGLYSLHQYKALQELATQLNQRSRRIEAQNRDLARASQLKSAFLASMSHELRTPLNAIIGFSEVLKDGLLGPLEPDQLDYIGEIFQSGHHLLALINDILDLSKIEAGKMELDLQTVDLPSAVNNALTVMKERADRGGITMSQSIAPGLASITADDRKLHQILLNLLSNAVKFTPRGGTVHVEITGDQAEIELSVVDSGIGIAKADLPRLFRAFEQLDAGIARKYEGTGLGLAMIKRLAELHGGTVGVQSEVGKGSRFWVRLPRQAPGSRPSTQSDQTLDPSAEAAGPDTPRVLAIDDDPAALDLARQWLSREGYAVDTVTDCDAAWKALAQCVPDVILLDILFAQEAKGWDLLEKLKADTDFATIPVIIVSIVAALDRGLALGAVSVLQKPVAGAELLRAVESLDLHATPSDNQVRILVVDDDPRAANQVATRLEAAGMLVTQAYGGADALVAAAGGEFSAVILDLMMPDISGFEVLQTLRARPATAALPVIILTAKLLDLSERAELEQQVAQVLSKGDWDDRQFLRTVHGAIRSAGQDRRPTPHARQGRPRVLVVDDDLKAVQVVSSYFADQPLDIACAHGGMDALAAIRARRPDLVILDLLMPQMSGFDVLSALRTDPDTVDLPVVILSAKPLTSADRQALARKVQAVFNKGTTSRLTLLDHVWKLLDSGGRAGANASASDADANTDTDGERR